MDEFADLRLEAAGLLLPGTCRLVVEALPPTKPAPPWWMRCGWLDAPRSPEPGVSVTAYDLDDRYKRVDAAAAAAAAAGPARLVSSRLVAVAHARDVRSCRRVRSAKGGSHRQPVGAAAARGGTTHDAHLMEMLRLWHLLI